MEKLSQADRIVYHVPAILQYIYTSNVILFYWQYCAICLLNDFVIIGQVNIKVFKTEKTVPYKETKNMYTCKVSAKQSRRNQVF